MIKPTLVNGKNYFNEESLAEMVRRLEEGERITIYIDCIGHTRNAMETFHYEQALKDRFGDKLIKSNKDYWKDYYYLN